ncbi:helix-turn-helix domain-containing protein [Paraburkholderia sp. BR10882]|uniref:helix-turn-helix domain-containing protein n=1 Tax=unclassified Paraburkholderia TaxID=2615204 RepID=UPI0034CD9DFF
MDETRNHLTIATGKTILLATNEGVKAVSAENPWSFHKISLCDAAKLLVFLERNRENVPSGRQRRKQAVIIETPGNLTVWNFEAWLIRQAVRWDARAVPLFDFLRAQETYGLVRFLLDESVGITSIAALSQRYGVSESHFRRLCRQALGNGLKLELRRWRAAMAVLDVVGGSESLTDLATRHGFSSSSHFSREIRNLFGFSPRQVRRSP